MHNTSNSFSSKSESSAISSQLREEMRVLSSDGLPIGTIDHIEGDDRIKLKRSDSPDGEHHYLSVGDVERVEDDAVIVSMSHAQATEFLENEKEGLEPGAHNSDASKVDQKEGTAIGQNPDEPERFVS